MQRSLAAEAQLLCKVKGDARETVDHRLPQQKVVKVAQGALTCGLRSWAGVDISVTLLPRSPSLLQLSLLGQVLEQWL